MNKKIQIVTLILASSILTFNSCQTTKQQNPESSIDLPYDTADNSDDTILDEETETIVEPEVSIMTEESQEIVEELVEEDEFAQFTDESDLNTSFDQSEQEELISINHEEEIADESIEDSDSIIYEKIDVEELSQIEDIVPVEEPKMELIFPDDDLTREEEIVMTETSDETELESKIVAEKTESEENTNVYHEIQDMTENEVQPKITESPSEKQSMEYVAEIKESEAKPVEDTVETIDSIPKVKPDPVASRSVRVKKNQYLDVDYPGLGWIYLGEGNGTNLIRYMGRKLGAKNTSFSLHTKAEGSTMLHFYRTDPLTGEALDDYLEVIVEGTNLSQERVAAPSYNPFSSQKSDFQAVDKDGNDDFKNNSLAQNKDSTNSDLFYSNKVDAANDALANNESSTVIEPYTSNSATEESPTPTEKKATEETTLTAEELLNTARSTFQRGEYEKALKYLTEFFDKAVTKIDEGFYLKGEILESNSSVRDIKQALEAYQTIVNEYPQSLLWQRANEKITYLKRFYFNIR